MSLAAGGAFLVYAGIRNVPLLEGLRELAGGRLPAPRPAAPTRVAFVGAAPGSGANIGSGGIGQAIADVAGFTGRYSLGAVKPHVEAAANEIGPRFGVRTIHGWAVGQFDHPRGLALDLMINNLTNGKSVGDAIAAYAITNAARLKIKYIIWYRRSWNPQRRTWVSYYGVSPHTDHVHLSFTS